MKNISELNPFTSDAQLNKYLLAGLQLEDYVNSFQLHDYIKETYKNNQITLDDVRRVYYEHFHVDEIEDLPYLVLKSCGTFGFEIERILKSDNEAAKLELAQYGYALEELLHDSEELIKHLAKLKLHQKECESILPEHFKNICSRLNRQQLGCQLTDAKSLLITFINDMFDSYSSDCYAKVNYNNFTNTYTYSIKFRDAFDYDFTHVEATRLLELKARFSIKKGNLYIYTNDSVDAQRVIDVVKFFFEEYM